MIRLAAVALVLVAVALCIAAPALKAQPPRDTLTGELGVQLNSPVLIVGEERKVYWLVFTGPVPTLGQIGDRIMIGGTIGSGGQFSYIVVESVK